MLNHISICNFAAIEKIDVDLDVGFSVVTGDSGSGKSTILAAIKAAFSERVDKSKIREGSDSATIKLEFCLDKSHAVWHILEEIGVVGEERDLLVIARSIPRKGASRARVNDCPVSGKDLNQIGSCLIEVHEQHAFTRFYSPNYARELVDSFVNPKLLENVNNSYCLYQAKKLERDEFDQVISRGMARQREIEFCLEKLEELAPELEEFDTLGQRRAILLNAEKIANLCLETKSLSSQHPVTESFSEGLRRLNKILQIDGLTKVSKLVQSVEHAMSTLERSLVEFQEFELALDILEDDCVFCPKDLEYVESRYQAYTSTARQIGCDIGGLNALWDTLNAERQTYQNADSHRIELERAVVAADQEWREIATTLSNARKTITTKLSSQINSALSDLRMDGVRVSFSLTTDGRQKRPEKFGMDNIGLLVHQSKKCGGMPLERAASGGELSRISLALYSVDVKQNNELILMLDEIDQGLNGAIASCVGHKLAKLAEEGQVIAVTHSPQIAAIATSHIRISKLSGKRPNKKVLKLNQARRVEEIAALISGDHITPEARAAAQKLLEAA